MNITTHVRRGSRFARMVSVLFFAAGVFTGPALARAADASAVQLWSIRATSQNAEISPQLKPLSKTLKKAFKFTGYKLLKTHDAAAKTDEAVTWKLDGGYRISVTPRASTGDKMRLEVAVTRREKDKDVKKLNTTIAVKREKFQLIGGWKLDDHGVLILALSAK